MTNPEALQLINKAQNITGLTLTSSLLCKKHFSPKLFFLKIADQEVFSLLFDCLNKKLACKFSGDTAESSKKDYKPLTLIAQFVRLYGVILSAENNKDGTLKERIKDTLAKNPGTGLYEKHIKALISSLHFNLDDLDTLFELLRKNLQKLISGPSANVAFDEALVEYHPSSAQKELAAKHLLPIPIVWIPRKPHPLGLLIYKAVVELGKSKKPFAIDFIPRICTKDTPQNSLREFINRSEKKNYHLICDSLFASVDLINELSAKNFFATFSISSKSHKFLFPLLKYSLVYKQWRAVQKGNLLISVFCDSNDDFDDEVTAEFQDSADELKIISESKTKYHQLITTAFQAPAGLF